MRIDALDLPGRDGDLKPHVGARIAGHPHDAVADLGCDLPGIPRRPDAPGAEGRVGVCQQLGMKSGLERPGPIKAHSPCIRAVRGALPSRTSASSLPRIDGRASFGQQPLGDVAIVDVGAAQELDQLVVARLAPGRTRLAAASPCTARGRAGP